MRRWTTPPTPPPRSARTSPRWLGARPAPTDSTATLGDLVSTDLNDFEDEVASELTLDLVRQAVDRLTDLQRQVIRHRFGFDGSDPASLQTTAERLGSRVRQG